MNGADLIARARMQAFISDGAQAPDYPDSWIYNELNDQQALLFSRPIVNARAGFWRKSYQFALTPGRSNYPMPQRACAGGLDKIDIAVDATLSFFPLREVDEDNARLYETSVPGPVCAFILRGDQICLLPVPDSSAFTIRITYYTRPSTLVPPQNNTPITGGGVDRGRITVWNPTTRVATLNALPFDQVLFVPAAITTGVQTIDVVRPTGWHELQVVSAAQSFSGLNLTIGGVDDVSTVQVGDYVRVAEQTDWPNLPDDYARTLSDATAVKILLQLGDHDKAQPLAQAIGGDLQRFIDLLTPRVKNTGGQDIVAPFGLYRGYGRTRVAKYP